MTTNSWIGPNGFGQSFGSEGTTDSNWSQDEVPTSTQDAVVATGSNDLILASGPDEDVGSISVGSDDSLLINGGASFAAENGTGANVNDGPITINAAALRLGNQSGTQAFNNGSTGAIELNSTSANAVADLVFAGNIDLIGSGVIEMTIGGAPSDNLIESTGLGATVVNESETISGTGIIGAFGLLRFINDGTIATNNGTSFSGGILNIVGSAASTPPLMGSFTNNGGVDADDGGTLIFGVDGEASTIVNNETIELDSTSSTTTMEIAGNVTISGTAGDFDTISLTGDTGQDTERFDQVVSNGNPATLMLVNQTIKGAGTIGDANLTLDNQSGIIDADAGPGDVLVLGTGNNTILNDGMLEATNDSHLAIDGPVDNTGTVEAENGLVSVVNTTVFGSGAVDIGQNGTLNLVAGTIAGNVTFTGTGAQLAISNLNPNGAIGGNIIGAESGDSISFGAIQYSSSDRAIWDQFGSAGGTLLLVNGSSTLATLNLAGQYANGEFSVQDAGGIAQVNIPNPLPPSGTSADMIMSDGSDGDYEIYDLGNNAILQAAPLGQISTAWQVAGVGGFDGTDTSDMMLRNSSSGAFEVYDIGNNNNTNIVSMGQVGLAWGVSGFADFSGNPGETDMLLQNSGTGAFEVYDISNNQISFATSMGQVGAPWVVAGFGDFSGHAGETGDMLMRNGQTGAFEVYDISDNTITFATSMGQVGLEWSVVGFGDFSGNGNETDMLMRDTQNGAFEIYDISNNAIYNDGPMGQVGLEWQVAGFGPIDGAGTSDMLMRNINTGAFEIYDIAGNQLVNAASMGQVGTSWSVAGIAADPPGASPANAQLAQAMASYTPAVAGALDTAALSQAAIQPPPPDALTAPNGPSQPAA